MTEDELKKLVNNYKPSQEILNGMANIQVFATVGPSASGKSTLMNVLIERSPGFKFILDETSRAPRPAEVPGVDFLFRAKEEILEDLKNGELVQVAIGPNGDLYSTRISSYPVDATGVIALVPAAVREFRKLPIKSFQAVFIVPSSFEIWQSWLAKQAKAGNWTPEKLQSRLAEAKASFEFALSDNDIRFVLNDNPQKAAGRLLKAAQGQKVADEEQAKVTAKDNYAKLLKLLNPSTSLRAGR